jgi:hypothetical protein
VSEAGRERAKVIKQQQAEVKQVKPQRRPEQKVQGEVALGACGWMHHHMPDTQDVSIPLCCSGRAFFLVCNNVFVAPLNISVLLLLLLLLLLLQARVAARLAEHHSLARAATEEAVLRERLTANTRAQLDSKLGPAIRCVWGWGWGWSGCM